MGVLQGLIANNGTLYAAWKGEPGDDRIFFSTFNGSKWAAQQTLGGNTSAGPSLGVYSGSIYAAWKGEWSDPRIFFSKLTGNTWSAQAEILNAYSDGGPALASLGTQLIAAWKSVFDQSMQYAIYNGSNWSAPSPIPGTASSVGPSLATFGTKLYAAWKGENSDQGIYYSFYNGGSWSAQTQIPNVATSVGPSLAAIGGTLYAVWKGEGTDQGIYYASFNGTSWTAQKEVANVGSSIGPAIANFNGELYAMWKGEGADVSLYDAFYNGSVWSAQQRNIPGNTGPDPLAATAPAPGPGLGSSWNYILTDNGTNLTEITASIIITEDLVSDNGFTFQLNCYCPHPTADNCAWQQYGFAIENKELSCFVNNWPVNWQPQPKVYVDLINQWPPLQSLSSNSLAAGYQLSLTLISDPHTLQITGFSVLVIDNHGATKANSSYTLTNLGQANFTSADEAPLNGFELNLVGPGNSASTTFTSGQGLFSLSAGQNLTASNQEPTGALGIGTAETGNSLYQSLPVSYPNGAFWQTFAISTTMAPMERKGGRVLRKPGKSDAAA